MIELSKKEILFLAHMYKGRDQAFYTSQMSRNIHFPKTTVWFVSESLSKKGLLHIEDRSRTKPFRLSTLGKAYAYLAQLKPSELIDFAKKCRNLTSPKSLGGSGTYLSGT